MLSNSSVVSEPREPKSNSIVWSSENSCKDGVRKEESVIENSEGLIGVLEVYIHQARDIHNICIYQKQDVYAKLCLTSDPETTVSTQIVNGGGKNPVFNENLRLNVRTVDSSLKCEIWMLSRVRNFLEDQLLGFALVPISDVLIEKGKLGKEFSLSSSDLFHSPSGFVQLTLTYTGPFPEVLEIPTLLFSLAGNVTVQDSGVPNSICGELDKIEFPDPKIVKENECMVSEYFTLESFDAIEIGDHLSSDGGVNILETFATDKNDNIVVSKIETPPISVPTNESPSGPLKSLNQDVVSSPKEKTEDVGEPKSGSSGKPASTISQPLISVCVEPEQKVVQQEIVDMYMKSMQQFTEALAKMKLPMDIENESAANSGSTSSDEKVQASSKENGPSPRVFYGSRAFF